MKLTDSRYVRLVLNNAIAYEDCCGEVEVLDGMRKEFDTPLVDESYYISSVDRAKQTKLSQGSPDVSCYDYPDGKIIFDGEKLAKIRRPGLDIAEVSEIVKDTFKETQENFANDIRKAKENEIAQRKAADSALSAQMDAITNKVVNTVQKTSKS